MKLFKYSLIGMVAIVITMGCRKNSQEVIINQEDPHVPVILDGYEPAVEDVFASVFGMVVDENQEPVEEAQVTLNDVTITTNACGIFSFDNVNMNKLGTFVKVEKAGYFEGGRRFFPLDGSNNNVNIELIPLNFNETFSALEEATVAISDNGGTIEFTANSIGYDDGTPYTGEVNIATTWLSPTEYKTFAQMPGALQGVNLSNEEVGLTSYGMLGVELQDSNGQPLNLLADQKATISLNVPMELQNLAPQEIPLWSFHPSYGIWVEEYEASLINGQYVGEVSHFSFWNCDYERPLITFDLTTVAPNSGAPIENIRVVFSTTQNEFTTGSGTTGSDGMVSGLIPRDELLFLEFYDICGILIFSELVGPFTDDVSLGNYEVDNNIMTITGSILNCDQELVEQPLLIVKQNGTTSYFQTSANPFTTNVQMCATASTIEIGGADISTFEKSEFVETEFVENFDAGEIIACGDALEVGFMRLTLDGVFIKNYPMRLVQVPDNSSVFESRLLIDEDLVEVSPGESITMSIFLNPLDGQQFADVPGDYSDDNQIALMQDTEEGFAFSQGTNDGGIENLIITEYGSAAGTEVSGYMSGNLPNISAPGSPLVFVEAEFAVLIQ